MSLAHAYTSYFFGCQSASRGSSTAIRAKHNALSTPAQAINRPQQTFARTDCARPYLLNSLDPVLSTSHRGTMIVRIGAPITLRRSVAYKDFAASASTAPDRAAVQ
jgi:hypothetical protein